MCRHTQPTPHTPQCTFVKATTHLPTKPCTDKRVCVLSGPVLPVLPVLLQVDAITDSAQALLRDVAEGRELPKAELDNLQKRRRLIKLE